MNRRRTTLPWLVVARRDCGSRRIPRITFFSPFLTTSFWKDSEIKPITYFVIASSILISNSVFRPRRSPTTGIRQSAIIRNSKYASNMFAA